MKNQNQFILHKRFIKFYRKNTAALFFSFALTFMLASSMLILIHTNHRTENIEYKTMFTPSDCLIEDLSYAQLGQLKSNPKISHVAVEEGDTGYCSSNGKSFYLSKGDDEYITLMATVKEGRLPRAQNEVAAEKWVLMNLGVSPKPGSEIAFEDSCGKTQRVTVTGILSDMRGNVGYGTLQLYAATEQSGDASYTAYITVKDGKHYDDIIKEVQNALGVSKKQIRKCPAREDFKELNKIDVQIIGVVLLICLVVFYGIYRIVLSAREKQYGILCALGMSRRQLLGMILAELYRIYVPGMFAGLIAGISAAYAVAMLSGDVGTVVYLYDKSVEYGLVIPQRQIVLCMIVMAALVGLTGFFAARSIAGKPVMETISGAAQAKRNCLHFPEIKARTKKLQALFSISCNYLFKNIKLSVFAIITLCAGIVLFTALAYKIEILQSYRADTKELWYLNGQYEMSARRFNSPAQGVPRQDADRILSTDGVSQIKTSAGIRVRVVDEDGVKRNDRYYEKMNADLKKQYGYDLRGHDGTNQIYKTALSGYNETALRALAPYVVSGDFEAEGLEEDEIILAVLSMDPAKENDIAGWHKDGKRLMDYQAGDEITVKYRADFDTDTLAYEMLADSGEYIYKTYKIAAIVSFEYMYDCNRGDIYPHLITSDENFRKIAPDGRYQCIYIDTDENISSEKQDVLERELISIGAESDEVSTRSLIGNIKQNEMFYAKQMVYIYSIAIVAFVLVLINIANNLKYRMHTRTREICMLRAVGMSVLMVKQVFLMENMILSVISAVAAYFLSMPVVRYLYNISDMKVYGHLFAYPYSAFLVIFAAAAALCMALSIRLPKAWETKKIMEAMGKAD